MKKIGAAAILSVFVFTAAFSQKVVVRGKVSDKQTEEAVPFANVVIKGTTYGVQTDFDGNYQLEIQLPSDSLEASSVGYVKIARKISGAREQIINFQLERAEFNLQEVVILPGENPALRIVRKTIENKPEHNKKNLDSYGYEAYNKIEIDLDDLTDKFKNRKIFQPFKFVFNNIDSVSEKRPFLPFFMTETVSDFFYRKSPVDRREIIKASKVSGVNDLSLTQFLGNMYVEIDVYEDWIYLLQRQFVSPLSAIGMNSYRYYLVDSQMIDNFWCYKIQFIPKFKGGLTFDGDMWVADSVFALKQISMKMSSDADVNFVKRISLFNDFVPVKDSIWMLKKEKLVIDFIKPKKGPGLIGRKTSSYKDYVVNAPEQVMDSIFVKQKSNVVVLDSANLRDESYWEKSRHDTLSFNEQRVYYMIDTLRHLPIVKTYLNLIQTIYLGYKDIGPIAIGNIFSFISYNDVEGWRFKYGMQTSNKFSKYVMLEAYAAYGLRDKRVKYGGSFLWLLQKNPRQSIGLSYRNDISSTSNYNLFYGNAGLLANFAVRRVEEGKYIPLKLVGVKELKADYYYEFNFGYSFDIGFVNRRLEPLGNFHLAYHTQNEDGRPNTTIKNGQISEFTVTQRFAWQEKFLSGEFNRLSLGSKYPIVFLQYGYGIRGLMNADFAYHRLVFGASDNQKLGPLGKLWWNIEIGRTWGTLPFLYLNMPDADESYVYNWDGMNTIRDYQFVADRYIKIILDHHLGGILFNRIPGIRKLKLREVWSARMWWGDLSPANRAANYGHLKENPYNTGLVKLQTADKMPLIELSVGIENILRVLRVDVFWRVTHKDPRGNAFSFRYGNFGVRAGLQLQF